MTAKDTSPEAEAIQIHLLRGAPTWKRLRGVAEMSETVMLLSAEAILGPELASRVYGR